MNKQHNNIKINVMKSSMHNETKQIKSKKQCCSISPMLQRKKQFKNAQGTIMKSYAPLEQNKVE